MSQLLYMPSSAMQYDKTTIPISNGQIYFSEAPIFNELAMPFYSMNRAISDSTQVCDITR
jgi:hypothetical protein